MLISLTCLIFAMFVLSDEGYTCTQFMTSNFGRETTVCWFEMLSAISVTKSAMECKMLVMSSGLKKQNLWCRLGVMCLMFIWCIAWWSDGALFSWMSGPIEPVWLAVNVMFYCAVYMWLISISHHVEFLIL